jgi:hypothetical protein
VGLLVWVEAGTFKFTRRIVWVSLHILCLRIYVSCKKSACFPALLLVDDKEKYMT